jgi:hypothetical protein
VKPAALSTEEAIRRDCGARARKFPIVLLAKESGVSRNAVKRFRLGKAVRPSIFAKIQRALIELEIEHEPPLPGTPEDLKLHAKTAEPLQLSIEFRFRDCLPKPTEVKA